MCVCVPLGVVLNPPRHANNNLGIKRETLPSLRSGAAPLKPLKEDGTFPATGMKPGIFQLGKQLRISKDFGNPKCQGGSSCSKIPVGISWSDGSSCLRWGLGDLRVPLYGQGDFWGVGFAAAPHTPRRSESIPGSREKSFPGKPLGPWRRRGAGRAFGCETISCLLLFSHFSAASAPEMSLFSLSLSPFPRPQTLPARLSWKRPLPGLLCDF